jgi:hypothetical protein
MLTRRIIAVLGVSAATLVGGAAAASASGSVQGPGALVEYFSSTNIMKVTDTACDGHAAYANWKTNTGDSGTMWNRNGCGSTVRNTIPNPGNNPANGETFFYRACVDDHFIGGDTCSAWKLDPHGF